jgi:flagellar FliJ protein
MKKYNFKLEPLLSHRQFLEDALQKEFAEKERQAAQARHIAKSLEEEYLHLAEELKEKMQAPRAASENALYATYLASLSDQINKQQQRVQEADKERDEKKTALLEAVKNRKMVEHLKEVGLDQFKQVYLKKEQAFSDEIGIQQHSRKSII